VLERHISPSARLQTFRDAAASIEEAQYAVLDAMVARADADALAATG
jgi:hypothetical protein